MNLMKEIEKWYKILIKFNRNYKENKDYRYYKRIKKNWQGKH
jgi:hypothetical protein